MIKNYFAFATVIGASISFLYFAVGQTTTKSSIDPIFGKRNPAVKYNQPNDLPLDWSWGKAQWTANDTPYVKIRREIDMAVAQKRLTKPLFAQIKSLAQQKPNDPLAQFRWGYALYNSSKAGIDLGPERRDFYKDATESLQSVAPPSSYQYARLRFLLLYARFAYNELKEIGKRLLRRNPQDYYVKYSLTWILSPSPKTAERQLALRYAQEMVREQPQRASAYGTLATVYEDRLFQLGDLAAADKGVAAAKKQLALLPKDKVDQRRRPLWHLKTLPFEKARQQREGFKPPVVAR